MSPLPRPKASPGVLVRALVSLGAVSPVAAAGARYAAGAAARDAFAPTTLGPLVALLTLLPVVVNATFYLELALGRSLAWVDAWLTARWETIVYACSVGLALAWLRLAHAGLGSFETAVVAAALAAATAASVYVIRLGVRADELALIQGLSQVIARDISLAKSFGRIQELTRRLVPWEQMGFARYDAHTNEMELVADTAAGGRTSFRFDANAGLTGEAVRLRRSLGAQAWLPGGGRAGGGAGRGSPPSPSSGPARPPRPGTRRASRAPGWRRRPTRCAPRPGTPSAGSPNWA